MFYLPCNQEEEDLEHSHIKALLLEHMATQVLLNL